MKFYSTERKSKPKDYMLRISPNTGEIHFTNLFYSALKLDQTSTLKVGLVGIDDDPEQVVIDLKTKQEIPAPTGEFLLVFEAQNKELSEANLLSFLTVTAQSATSSAFKNLSQVNDNAMSNVEVYERDRNGVCIGLDRVKTVSKYHNFSANLVQALQITSGGHTVKGFLIEKVEDLGPPKDKFVTKQRKRNKAEKVELETT
jgi:hypothetical protein